ncbi:MAG: alpha/beta fold hydrolase [Fulvivirga sp.]|uniref:alpha/beta hydrolase n=1 Tax=Fulvivirga sp. TaxID=1931237 RepID=UPI0032F07269
MQLIQVKPLKNNSFPLRIAYAVIFTIMLWACDSPSSVSSEYLTIKEQGSFAIGGKVISDSGSFDPINHGFFNPGNQSSSGQTLHGDHAYVSYQIPVEARKYPLVFWHGYGQFSKTWETTADGREGFKSIFLRRNFPVYVLDQPRRGRAGRSTMPTTITASPDDQLWFGIFRLGIYPNFYPGIQFSKKPEDMDQFYRQMTPDTGPLDIDVNIDAVSALFDKIGDGILVTHSHSGGMGWLTALKTQNIKGIVSYEPGSNFVFPEGEVPDPMTYFGGTLKARGVPMEEFKRLTQIPIIIYFGDNIPTEPSVYPGEEQWRVALAMAKKWTDVVNKHGGDVTIIHLPEIGIKGNTHFPFADLNNIEIADLMSEWLAEKGLN